MPAPKEGDLKAGLTGLFFAAILLLVAMTTIVKATNAHYAHEAPEAGASK